jgi:hypothetical protein
VYITKKNFYVLSKIENNTYHLFNLIKRDIPSSIFSSLNYKFFKNLIEEKIIHLYIIQHKKKTSAIITLTTVRNLAKLKYRILLFYLINPFTFILNIINVFKSLGRSSNSKFDKSYLHLLHFIIYKKKFMNISIKKKDKIINLFLKSILRMFKAKSLFLCYEKDNLKAHKFYLRNNYIIYNRNKDLVFVKKEIYCSRN